MNYVKSEGRSPGNPKPEKIGYSEKMLAIQSDFQNMYPLRSDLENLMNGDIHQLPKRIQQDTTFHEIWEILLISSFSNPQNSARLLNTTFFGDLIVKAHPISLSRCRLYKVLFKGFNHIKDDDPVSDTFVNNINSILGLISREEEVIMGEAFISEISKIRNWIDSKNELI